MSKIVFLQKLLADRKYYSSRLWSNKELRKFAPLFNGNVLNVSGWKDEDGEEGVYKNYFTNAVSYSISNYKSEVKGLQGFDNEFYLDLEEPLPAALTGTYDVVFNHTTLEHIFEVREAFKNLCDLSNDVVIIVVPFLQQMHGNYGDYWRFSPLAIKKLFEENGAHLLYLSFNNYRSHSVYIFAIASKKPDRWTCIRKEFSFLCNRDIFDSHENFIGCRAITNTLHYRIAHSLWRKFFSQ